MRLVLRLRVLRLQESAAVLQGEHDRPSVSLWRMRETGVFDGAVTIVAIVVRGEMSAGTVAEVDSGCKRDGFAPASDYGKTG